MSILLVSPRIYLVGALLAIIANTCFGASFVLLNSFLPLLVRHHPLMVKYQERPAADGVLNETSPLIESTRTSSSVASIELNLSTRISSFGVGIGYIGAVTLQIIAIVVVVTTHQTTFSLRLVLFLIGLWWFIFTIPASLWLRSRPGPPLLSDGKPLHSWTAYMAHAWKSLGKTVMRARRLKDILLFLAAWFLLSDGIATVSGTAVLFAKTELGMKPAALGLINVIVMVAGVCGAFSWSYMSSFFRLGASQTIIACILLFELIPLYGILGFSPSVQRVGLGLQQPWEMYPLGAVYGLVMGGLSSYCRSFFAELIPPGYEAAFYALDRVYLALLLLASSPDRYGGIRPAFIFLAVLIFLPLPLMLLVDVERGKQDALELGSELDRDIHTGGFSYDSVPTAGRCEGDIGETLANP
ncbi:Major facilitator superfamily domain general substrate transporter [Penicillium chermesinum]|nr:Major facilitator superfamily domain general substrate transporter [Penicillium chermesinum]